MIEFNHVTRSYSRKVAVDDLSLSVPPGEKAELHYEVVQHQGRNAKQSNVTVEALR